jgi:hypothetical protein
MTNSYRTPVLPDPGHDRWWEISLDGDYWDLTLYEEAKNITAYYNGPDVVVHETLTESADARDFERAATNLLARLDKATAYVGTYHKPEGDN